MIVTQEWTHSLPMMQQTVLLTAIRGADNSPKYGQPKMLIRWYRRCILLSAMDGKVLNDPCSHNGGSFTGPSLFNREPIEEWEPEMDRLVKSFNEGGAPWCDHDAVSQCS